jgi:hypothetical protein
MIKKEHRNKYDNFIKLAFKVGLPQKKIQDLIFAPNFRQIYKAVKLKIRR